MPATGPFVPAYTPGALPARSYLPNRSVAALTRLPLARVIAFPVGTRINLVFGGGKPGVVIKANAFQWALYY